VASVTLEERGLTPRVVSNEDGQAIHAIHHLIIVFSSIFAIIKGVLDGGGEGALFFLVLLKVVQPLCDCFLGALTSFREIKYTVMDSTMSWGIASFFDLPLPVRLIVRSRFPRYRQLGRKFTPFCRSISERRRIFLGCRKMELAGANGKLSLDLGG